MTICEKQFTQLLRAVIANGEMPVITDWAGIMDLSRRHHLEVIVREAARNYSDIPDVIRSEIESAYNLMLAHSIRRDHCLLQIEEALAGNSIQYALLKGAILKDDYPDTFYRFMSDLDFYIRTEDRAKIRKAVEKAGGEFRGKESGDDQFIFRNTIGVEFHGRLLYRNTKHGIENYPDWSLVDEHKNRLTEEGFALNLLGHAVHDLAGAGPGIRYILDLWVYRHRHAPQPDWNAVDERMKTDLIYEAAHNLLDLSEYLFGDGVKTDLMEEMAEYVMKGGLHGDYKRGLASQAAEGKATVRQIFRNRAEFENRYPWLKKYPFLLPVAWVMRLFHSFKTHKKTIKEWKKGIDSVSEDETEIQKRTRTRFGL